MSDILYVCGVPYLESFKLQLCLSYSGYHKLIGYHVYKIRIRNNSLVIMLQF